MRTCSSTSLAVEVRDRELEAVEHREQLFDEPFGRALDERGLLAQHALAVVLEVGLQATRGVEQVVALALQRVEVAIELLGLRGGRILELRRSAGPGSGRSGADRVGGVVRLGITRSAGRRR